MDGAFMAQMGGAFRLKWVGHLWLRWVGQLWQSELLFLGIYAKKNTGLQGSTMFCSVELLVLSFNILSVLS